MEKTNFIDYIRVFCRSGHGGAGSRHFMRTKFNPQAGPDGGDGGRGGHIILKGNKNLRPRFTMSLYTCLPRSMGSHIPSSAAALKKIKRVSENASKTFFIIKYLEQLIKKLHHHIRKTSLLAFFNYVLAINFFWKNDLLKQAGSLRYL